MHRLLLGVILFATTSGMTPLRAAPPIGIVDTRGNLMELPNPGKVALVYFWATWSEPGVEHLRTMEALQRSYGSRGLNVLAINVDADPQRLASFLRSTPSTVRIAHDTNRDVTARYDLPRMPTAYVIRDGSIHHEYQDLRNRHQTIARHVEALLP